MPEQELVVTLVRERETKNTIRYAEQEDPDGLPHVIGTLYIQKYAVRKLGDPNRIVVSIRKE